MVLVEHISLSLNNIILVARVDIPHALWQLGAEHTCLVSFRDMDGLEYVLDDVGRLVSSELKPDVVLAYEVSDGDAGDHHFVFSFSMIEAQAVGFDFVVF